MSHCGRTVGKESIVISDLVNSATGCCSMIYFLLALFLLFDNVNATKPHSKLCKRELNYTKDCTHQLSNISSCNAEIERNQASCESWDFDSKYTRDVENHYMTLKTYCYDHYYILRALNITFNAANWIEGMFRFTVLSDEHNVCVKFVMNSTNLIDMKVFYDCIWYPKNLDGLDIRLEYQLKNENDLYISNGKYIMHLPPCALYDYKNNVSDFYTIVYVNQDYLPNLTLHIQKMPIIFNITEYRIKMCVAEQTNETSLENNNTGCIVAKNLNTSTDDDELIVYLQMTDYSAAYFFIVEAKHEDCGDQYCYVARTPLIKLNPDFLFLYIIASIMLLTIFIAILAACVFQLKSKLFAKCRTKVLLLHDPVHTLHTNVVKNLASALKMYNIDVMLDVTDIQKSNIKNPVLWYSLIMSKVGHAVIISTPKIEPDTNAMFKDLYAIGLRFVNEIIKNKSSNLNIINMLPPYCSSNDISPELKHFKTFKLMKQFRPMVRYLQSHKMINLADLLHNKYIELTDDFKKMLSELNTSIDEMKGIPLFNEDMKLSEAFQQNFIKAKYYENEINELHTISLDDLEVSSSNKRTDSEFVELVNVNQLILDGKSKASYCKEYEEPLLVQQNSVHSLSL